MAKNEGGSAAMKTRNGVAKMKAKSANQCQRAMENNGW
jgi:hypothetical protein